MKKTIATVLFILTLVIILITINELFTLSSFVPTENDYKLIEKANNAEEMAGLLSDAKHYGYTLSRKELIVTVILLCSVSLISSISLFICVWRRPKSAT